MIYPDKHLFEKFCRPCHAWSLTIHKFQGSETDTVVYGVSGSFNENWQHVYTAVTRGKKNVIIVGKFQDLKKAVERTPRPRQTALKLKIKSIFNNNEDRDFFNDSFDECLSQMAFDDDDDNGESPPKKAKNMSPLGEKLAKSLKF